MIEKKLGRGLDSLIEATKDGPLGEGETVPCSLVSRNPHQPREDFDEEALEQLAESIRNHGILQPIVVRRSEGGFELIAGERRLEASRRAGKERIPVVIRAVSDDQMLELALVENLQREDLNAIEKARAFRRYVDELDVTHEEAARKLGCDRSSITNQLRLLELPDDLQAMVSRGTLSMGHARALLGASDDEIRRRIARRIVQEGLSVRETERLVREARTPEVGAAAPAKPSKSAYFEDLERRLRERFATKAKIAGSKKKGRITLEYFSMEELGRLLELLLEE